MEVGEEEQGGTKDAEMEGEEENMQIAEVTTAAAEVSIEKADSIAASDDEEGQQQEPAQEEPPVKKPKVSSVAEEALRKIEEAKAKAAADAIAAEEAAKKAKTAELEKFWKAVREDPGDFTGWTYLLQHVDGENDGCVRAGPEGDPPLRRPLDPLPQPPARHRRRRRDGVRRIGQPSRCSPIL